MEDLDRVWVYGLRSCGVDMGKDVVDLSLGGRVVQRGGRVFQFWKRKGFFSNQVSF